MKLNGKRALVTGGAVRIGAAIVRMLQDAGAEVVVHGRRSKAEAEALGVPFLQADLRDPAAADALFAQLAKRFGPVDLLVNNAAVFHKDPLAGADSEKTATEFQINLFAPLQLIRCFARQTSTGAVVNLLDRRIRSCDTSCVPYLLTKKGLEELTRLAALELAPGIRVNAVAPGAVLPPPGQEAESVRERAGRIPLETTPVPEQIAEAVQFMLQADQVTGQTLFVDGGQHLLGNGV
jgi:NAD(P)-dependent dehydrogenase (short-subunit alcohol dehydrogenase family)